MDFNELIKRFISTGTYLRERAVVAVNRAATVRNWCFGIFIVEYEQNGEDRAQYGERLIERLSFSLTERGMKGVSVTALKLCRQFYLAYPEIGQTLTDQFEIPLHKSISDVFVSKYKLALPTEEELKRFIQKELQAEH
jgi:hypothetical protein